MFISFEGVDGSGKTTQVELLRRRWADDGKDVVATREPGGTPFAERVREVLLGGEAISPWAEATLFAAARAELVARVIRPALERGAQVLSDRYVDSSLAYQGVARGLGVEQVLRLNLACIEGLLPDRTFVLLVDVDEAIRRRGRPRDRLEGEGRQLVEQVDRGYRELAARFPDRVVAIDASASPEAIAGQVLDGLTSLCPLAVREVSEQDREFVDELVNPSVVVSRGQVHRPAELPGFVALLNSRPAGLATYRLDGSSCELVSLESVVRNRGVGSALVEAVCDAARARGCRRLWLITTNDNVRAIRFYQRRGFVLSALHPGAIEHSRRLKPEIPIVGCDDIPIRDELELELAP